jgi:flagellar hook-associated protein 2
MSVSPSSAFNFTGVVSGLDTNGVISKLMSLQQGPLHQLQQQESAIKTRDSAYQTLKGQISSFQIALQSLLLPTNVNAKTATSSSTSVATATANADAINSSFSVNVARLATATSVASANAITSGVDSGAASGTKLQAAGLSIGPTAGSFTINGVQISVDPANDTLQNVLDRINTATAAAPGSVGVVATLVNDSNGNPNFIQLTNAAGNASAIQLGSTGDTSNFLTATHLVSSGVAGGAVTSNAPLSATSTSAALSSNRFAAGTLDSSGTVTINGVAVAWQNTDSLSTVLNRINSSNAGVLATYDPTTDKVRMVNVKTGSQTIAMSDSAPAGGSIGLLQALGLNASNEQAGQTAQYQITQNAVTGPTLYSNSNTITGSVPGVTLTLTGQGTTNIAVAQDTQTAVNNVQTFVNAFNTLVDAVDKDTAYDSTNKQGSVLTGDATIQNLESQLRSMVSSAAPGMTGQYNSLASLGISTGAIGSPVGTTSHLTVDTTKLTTALQNNPSAVYSVLSGNASATLNPDSSGNAQTGSWISSLSGAPTSTLFGQYQLTVDSSGNISSVFTPTGQPAQKATTAILTGGVNSTLIPGVTITAGALPVSGTVSDTIAIGQNGVLGRLNSFLNGVLGVGGLFDTESQGATSQVQDLDSRISDTNAQLAQQQQILQQQFSAMETALAQIQSQNSSLLASLGSSSSGGSSMLSSSSSK